MSGPDGTTCGRRRRAIGLATVALVGGCGSADHRAQPQSSPTTSPASTSTTVAGPQTSGSRTVLGPIGVHVRAQPDTTSPVLASAAQGTVLEVLGHTDAAGGWYEVKGATVTGWMTADANLSAPGKYRAYSSSGFSALYPDTWTATDNPSGGGATFRAAGAAGSDDIVALTGPNVAALPHGRSGYGRVSVKQIVVCGVTSALVLYQSSASPSTLTTGAPTTGAPTSGPTAPPSPAGTTTTSAVPSPGAPVATTTSVPVSPYLAEVRLTLDPTHALGFYADLATLGSDLDTFRAVLSSTTFQSPQCGG